VGARTEQLTTPPDSTRRRDPDDADMSRANGARYRGRLDSRTTEAHLVFEAQAHMISERTRAALAA